MHDLPSQSLINSLTAMKQDLHRVDNYLASKSNKIVHRSKRMASLNQILK